MLKSVSLWAVNLECTTVIYVYMLSVFLDGPEGGTVTVGDFYRKAEHRKLHQIMLLFS